MKLTGHGLVVQYAGAARRALDDVSLEIPPGSFSAVLGPNGSGKSTLMRALLGVAPLSGGVVTLDERPLAEWNRKDLARSVGAVSQTETIAFPLSVTDLVGMGRYPHLGPLEPGTAEDRAAIRAALDACDLLDLEGRDVTTLSGGEFQRARIARALCQEPRALVLDEPTSSLDIRHQMGILELLRDSADRGMTVLLVTHSLDRAAQFADHILLLAEGRVVADGEPSDVLTAATLERVYEWPVTVEADARAGGLHVTPLRSRPPE